MGKRRRFGQLYIRYVVKSSWLFYAYLGVFTGIFLFAATKLQLEERKAYEGEIQGCSIRIRSDSEPELLGDRIYLYTDKNQEVQPFSVRQTQYRDGVMHIVLYEEQNHVQGKVTVETVSGKNTLFKKIFAKAGT